MSEKIRSRVRDTILQALSAGVVPRTGIQHIQVGRHREIKELLRDIERISGGGAGIRFVIGDYGSGKTFFLNLVREMALHKKLVTVQADLSPDLRLYSSRGQSRALYSELLRGMSTRSRPDGGALTSVVERFVMSAISQAESEGCSPDEIIARRMDSLTDLVGGFDFAAVIRTYWEACDGDDSERKQNAIRWLRGEFSTKTEARQVLGVRTIVDDSTVYDHLKLMALFCRLAGYSGLLVCIDELVSIYMLQNSIARRGNYEVLLRVVNDSIQGNTSGIGFVMAGTPEFLQDHRRGINSHEALSSRLAGNSFATGGLVDFTGPVIRLQNLTQEDLYILLGKIRNVFRSCEDTTLEFPDEAITAFMKHCMERIGEAYFRTPRTSIRSFVQLLSVLDQNPGARWEELVNQTDVAADSPVALTEIVDDESEGQTEDDELATFRL